MTPEDCALAEARVNKAIVEVILPRLYTHLDTLVGCVMHPYPTLTQRDIIEIRKLLPAWCDNSLTK